MAANSKVLSKSMEGTRVVFTEAYSSFLAQFAALSSIFGFYAGIVAFLHFHYSKDFAEALILAIPLWAAILVGGVGVTCLRAYLKLREKIRKGELEEAKDQKYLCELGARHFGRVYKSIEIEVYLSNEGALNKGQTFVLEAKGENVGSIDYISRTPEVPDKNADACHVIDAQAKDHGKIKIRPKEVKISATECIYKIYFIPGIKDGKNVKYFFEHKSPNGAFAMTDQELKKREMKFEYYAHEIRYPTEHLNLKLYFPQGFEPLNPNVDVWIGRGQDSHDNEKERVRKYFNTDEEKGRYYCELAVPYPLQGLAYC